MTVETLVAHSISLLCFYIGVHDEAYPQRHTIRVPCTSSAPWRTIDECLTPIDKSFDHNGRHVSQVSKELALIAYLTSTGLRI